jgi:hypothetical protein
MLKRLLAIVALGAALVACTPSNSGGGGGSSPDVSSPDVTTPTDEMMSPETSPEAS